MKWNIRSSNSENEE